jgi:peptidoglycan/xylan/chitin deacetylase (PgdA/CDA1 family)
MPGSKERVVAGSQIPGYGFYILAGTFIVFCLQTLIFLLLIRDTIGPFSFFRRQKPPDPALARQLRVALLRSDASAQLFSNQDLYAGLTAHWAQILNRLGIPARVYSDAQLAQGFVKSEGTSEGNGENVLILPFAICLGPGEREAILHFLRDGNGVVASGPLGIRESDCSWRGWDFLSSVTGVPHFTQSTTANLMTTTPRIYAAFRGDQFYSPGVPTGFRMEIPSQVQELTLGLAQEPDVYLSDWMLRPSGGYKISESALAVHTRYETGRVVWLGFNEVLPADRAADQVLLDNYATSAVRWAGKQPMPVLANWPTGHESSMLVAEEVQPDPAHSIPSARFLKQEGVPATFLYDATEAGRSPAAVKDSESMMEVASLGDTFQAFTGQLALHQAARLNSAKQNLRSVTGKDVFGFAPPFGLTDAATVVALNDARYLYYLNEIGVTRAVPEIIEFFGSIFFPFQKTQVLKLFRTSSDDFAVLANYHGPSPPGPDLAEGFLADFRRLQYLHGVYVLYLHSYLLGDPRYQPILKAILDKAKAQPVWITTGKNLAEWWSARARVEIQARKITANRISLNIANKGEDDLDHVTVNLYLPYRPKQIAMTATIFRLGPPQFHMLDRDNILQVDFRRLSAQTNYNYIVHLDE